MIRQLISFQLIQTSAALLQERLMQTQAIIPKGFRLEVLVKTLWGLQLLG